MQFLRSYHLKRYAKNVYIFLNNFVRQLMCREGIYWNEFCEACRVTFVIMLLFGAQETFSGPLLDSIIERSVLGEDEPSSGTVSLPKGVRLLRDIPYGNDAKQIMDVYAPLNATHAPVVFMVHGGAWRTGTSPCVPSWRTRSPGGHRKELSSFR